jgi:hypothetical protein
VGEEVTGVMWVFGIVVGLIEYALLQDATKCKLSIILVKQD